MVQIMVHMIVRVPIDPNNGPITTQITVYDCNNVRSKVNM